MKFGFNLLLFTTFVEEEHAPLFAWVKSLGYDGIEIPTGDGPPEHYKTVRQYADDAGLQCTSVAMATPETDPSSPDPKIRAAGLQRLRERIEAASYLGTPVIGGPLYAAHRLFHDQPPTVDNMKWSADVLAEAGDIAAQAGITLAVEPLNRFEIMLLNCADQARQLVDFANHPNVAILYDTHHAHIEERSHQDGLATCGDKLAHVHLSESHRGTLGAGLVDWAAVREGLQSLDYDAWCVCESFGVAVDGLRQAACVHRDCFESREEVVETALPFMRDLVS